MSSSSNIKVGELKIYPNPANESVFVLSSKQMNKSNLSIFNHLGQCFKSGMLGSANNIDISELAKGIYYIEIQNHEISLFFIFFANILNTHKNIRSNNLQYEEHNHRNHSYYIL